MKRILTFVISLVIPLCVVGEYKFSEYEKEQYSELATVSLIALDKAKYRDHIAFSIARRTSCDTPPEFEKITRIIAEGHDEVLPRQDVELPANQDINLYFVNTTLYEREKFCADIVGLRLDKDKKYRLEINNWSSKESFFGGGFGCEYVVYELDKSTGQEKALLSGTTTLPKCSSAE